MDSGAPRLTAARQAVLRAGALALMRAIDAGRGARIIAYHRFGPADVEPLRRQCEYLCKHHAVVSLDDIDRWLNDNASLPRNATAVTIDDGYRDFYRVAYPIFREYRIPVTVFLATGFLDHVCWLWCDAVTYLFRTTAAKDVEVCLGGRICRFTLSSDAERAIAIAAVKEDAKRLPHHARAALVYDTLPALLNAALPTLPPEEYAPLSWDEVRQMSQGGIGFGAHTQTHPILASLDSDDMLENEIVGSKRRLEEELGRPIAHFAYPNGRFDDVNSKVLAHVRKAGFRSAFLAEAGANGRSAERYTLRRNVVEPATAVPLFGRNILRCK